MTEGTLVHWRWTGKQSLGYLQKWSLPVPGDLIDMVPDTPNFEPSDLQIPAGVYRVLRRRFEQPEREQPYIVIELEVTCEL